MNWLKIATSDSKDYDGWKVGDLCLAMLPSGTASYIHVPAIIEKLFQSSYLTGKTTSLAHISYEWGKKTVETDIPVFSIRRSK